MNKIFSFLKKSNRYKHLVGGLLVGLCALSPWAAIYSAIIAASCLELKDKLHGCPWDWIDWVCLHSARRLHRNVILAHCVIFIHLLHRE